MCGAVTSSTGTVARVLEVWGGTKGGELVDKVQWWLDVLEMLTDRAEEKLVEGEYGEAHRIVSVIGWLIGQYQNEAAAEE